MVEMEQPCLGADLEACGPREKSVKRTSVPKSKSDRKGSFPKFAGEQPTKPKKLAGMPTNVKIENMPENVQNPLNPTKNIKLAEKPSKYKKTKT